MSQLNRRTWIKAILMVLFAATFSYAQSNTFPSSGDVGIGTTSPAASLDISPAPSGDTLRVQGAGTGLNFVGGLATPDAGVVTFGDGTGWKLSFGKYTDSGATKFLTIQDNGNIGIGTTTPNTKLTLTGTIFLNTWGTNVQQLLFNSAGTYYATFYDVGSNNTFALASTNSPNGAGSIVAPIMSWGLSSNNVGIGTTNPQAKLEINGGLRFSGDLAGTVQTTAWTGVLCGGDYAESVGVSGEKSRYEPGDVLIIDPANSENFLKSSIPYATTVAGIYSTRPGAIGSRSKDPEKVKAEIPMAMVGIVPTKVSAENGPIRRGDLLVTASLPGYAMRGTDRTQMLGAVVGKALEPLEHGTGLINVLVTLQ